jgi:phage terminase small subunit
MLTGRQEKFARFVAEGRSLAGAYRAAGYAPSKGNPGVLAANKSIQARVQELRARAEKIEEKAVEDAAKELKLTKKVILQELMRIGFSDIRRVVDWCDRAWCSRTAARLTTPPLPRSVK